jgi:putative inorganic carbon (HCO3(-)) transporter
MPARATTGTALAGLPGSGSRGVELAARVGICASPYPASLCLSALTSAAAPAYVVRWHVGPYPTTLLEALIGLTVLAFALESARAGVRFVWRTPYTYAAALFLAAGLVAVLVAPDRRAAVGLYRAYLLEPIAFFYVAGEVLRTAGAAYLVLGSLGLGGLVAGLANSAVVLAAWQAHHLNLAVAAPVVIYNTPNAVALYLVPLIAVGSALALHAEDRRLRVGAALFTAAAGLSTLLSFSRGGYAALVAVAVGLALSHRRRWYLLGAEAVVALVLVKVPPVANRLGHQLSAADPNNSLVSRVKLWEATVHMLRDHPVLGTGLSGFARSIGPYRGGIYSETLIYPHNILLNSWTETGLLGVVAFGWLLVQGLRTTLRGWRECLGEWRPLQLGLLLALVAIVVHGMVDVPYWKNDLSFEFWALLGVSWAGLRWGRPPVPAA